MWNQILALCHPRPLPSLTPPHTLQLALCGLKNIEFLDTTGDKKNLSFHFLLYVAARNEENVAAKMSSSNKVSTRDWRRSQGYLRKVSDLWREVCLILLFYKLSSHVVSLCLLQQTGLDVSSGDRNDLRWEDKQNEDHDDEESSSSSSRSSFFIVNIMWPSSGTHSV